MSGRLVQQLGHRRPARLGSAEQADRGLNARRRLPRMSRRVGYRNLRRHFVLVNEAAQEVSSPAVQGGVLM